MTGPYSTIHLSAHASTNDGQNVGNVSSSVEDLFTLLESSGKPHAVQEVKQLINEQYNEGMILLTIFSHDAGKTEGCSKIGEGVVILYRRQTFINFLLFLKEHLNNYCFSERALAG